MSVKPVTVKQILDDAESLLNRQIILKGWVRTIRSSKNVAFIELNDGTCFKNMQIVVDENVPDYDKIIKYTIGSSLHITGEIVKSEGREQAVEIKANQVLLDSLAEEDYPLQKKRHSFEFLRTMPHIRVRSNTFIAVFRVRSIISHAIHKFFQDRDFVYVHTPILTSVDAEGAGEIFQSTTLDMEKPPKKDGSIDYSQELLGSESFLTVSGQLNVEPFCMAFKNVYTFGPTFRAENSNTARHACEFWMIEPEIAFGDLNDDMQLAEDMFKYLLNELFSKCGVELEFFNKFIDKGLINRLESIANAKFGIITYTEAIDILQKSNEKFEYPTDWGVNLQAEHERYIVEKVLNKPTFVINYPKKIKAFYMRLNDDGKTVGAMDMLVPGVGELIGGSQREERYDVLLKELSERNMDVSLYQGYLDTRKYGSFVHSGFGLGLERALMYLTGMKNIRDVIPYPRTPNTILF